MIFKVTAVENNSTEMFWNPWTAINTAEEWHFDECQELAHYYADDDGLCYETPSDFIVTIFGFEIFRIGGQP